MTANLSACAQKGAGCSPPPPPTLQPKMIGSLGMFVALKQYVMKQTQVANFTAFLNFIYLFLIKFFVFLPGKKEGKNTKFDVS